jgi:hypothetical protein
MRYPRYPNLYPQFAHDPTCHCCHPNDRPYCDCPCHRAESGEITALRARWDIEGRIPMGGAIGGQAQPPQPPPIKPAPAPTPTSIDRAARLAELRKKRGG